MADQGNYTKPESDKQRRQHGLDRLAFEILAARHTGPESWMRWIDWHELTKARRGDRGLGNTTFSECTKRLLDQGRIRRSQIAKNRFYQVVFTPGSSLGVISSEGENGGNDHSAVVSDKGQIALQHLLSKKPPGVV
jgi:hypothetical protein